MSYNMTQKIEFRTYVRGYEPKAAFPHSSTFARLGKCIFLLQKDGRLQRTDLLIAQFGGKACLDLQLDMWTDSETHTVYAAVTQTMCIDPTEDPGSTAAQLFLQSELIDFDVFPETAKTGPNIRKWFAEDVLVRNKIPCLAVSGVTPDGAADGQCGLALIPDIREKVDTCLLHQLQRSVLYSIGLAGKTSKNPDAKQLLRKHNRVVMLSRQALAFGKDVKKAQSAAGVPEKNLLTLETTAVTRWGNQYKQVSTNCVLRSGIDPSLEKYQQNNRNNKEAIVENDESEGGSKVGKAVAASEIGLDTLAWDQSQEIEAFLAYPYDIKETIEHAGICTGSQALILLHDLKEKCCRAEAKLEVKEIPSSLSLAQRERAVLLREGEDLHSMTTTARSVMKEELHTRAFENRPSNSRLIQCFMSKQQDAKEY
ncbi:hypothetical protein CYMTET_47179 [Cymbomonas tetramitiformis]|uniref:Uncharacterized protein n=1 Tax=Cymbomonas tetramitiformis TaxID=36881 RepID=A0AAE0BUQ3_9CHLO|nr:hypothetical protein CYMTET_47179 [Cymbomonas tetramitiformis]